MTAVALREDGMPGAPARRRAVVPLRWVVAGILLGLALLVAGGLILYSLDSNRRIALVSADALLDSVGNRVAEHVTATIAPIRTAVGMTAALPDAEVSPTVAGHALDGYLRRLLAQHPSVSSAYIGFADGAFHQVFSVPEGASRLRDAVRAPAAARWAVRWITTAPDGRRVEIWRYKDADLRTVGSRHAGAGDFDPRRRPWYEAAVVRFDETVATVPYRFASTGEVGVTFARQLEGIGRGVLGVDLTLAGLSRVLSREDLGPDALLMIVGRDGSILADNRGLADSLSVQAAGDPLASVLHRRVEAGSEEVIRRDGRDFLVRVLAMPPLLGADQHLAIAVPVDRFTGAITEIGIRSAVFSALALLLLVPLVVLVSRLLTGPLDQLTREAEEIRSLQFDGLEPAPSRIAEIQTLEQAMGLMRQGLRTFGVYVPRSLVDQVLISGTAPALGGSRRELTVLFTDIAGFTTISESLPPEETMLRLSDYLSTLSAAVMAEGGAIDKYIGDAIMAMWNAPLPDPDHAARACVAALRMDRLSRRMEDDARARGLVPLHTRIGLATGDAIVGNVGSADRMNYTAVGSTVNLGARLEGLNKAFGTTILTAGSVVEPIADRFLARPLGRVKPKGTVVPTRLYNLMGAQGPDAPDDIRASDEAHALAAAWAPAHAAYDAGEFAAAAEAFAAIAARFPEDEPARLFAARAAAYRDAPPADWTGVEEFHEK
jgi:adenylate cyclase